MSCATVYWDSTLVLLIDGGAESTALSWGSKLSIVLNKCGIQGVEISALLFCQTCWVRLLMTPDVSISCNFSLTCDMTLHLEKL